MNEQIKRIFDRCVEKDGPLSTPCLIWTGTKNDGRGYGRIGYQGKHWLVHRLVYELCVEPIPPGMQVNHECYQPDCCNPLHIKLGDYRSNARDTVRNGRSCAGEVNPSAVLRREQVVEILRLINEGKSNTSIARHFGVCINTIIHIAYGRTWKDVPGPRKTLPPPRPSLGPPIYRRPIVIRKEERPNAE